MGLSRDAPAITESLEEEERLKAQPKIVEQVPEWAEKVPRLEKLLQFLDELGNIPRDEGDESADPDMLMKGVLTTRLAIFFI